MAAIFSLFGEIFVDKEKAQKSINDVKDSAKDTSKTFAEKFGDVAKTAVKVGTVVAGATTAAVGGLTAMANQTASVADEIDKGSIRMGISTKSYQELKYAAGQCGVEMANLEKAAKKLEGTDMNLGDAFKEIMAFSTAEERATKAAELFGDNIAYTLSPLIEQNTDDYDALIQRASDLGLIMGDDAVKAGVTFGDTMSDITQSLGALGNGLMSSAIPLIQELLNFIMDRMPQIQSMVNKLAPILVSLLQNILPIFMKFAESLFPTIFDLLEQLLPVLSEIVSSILPIFTDILNIILPPLIQIIEELLPAVLPLISAILPILQPIFELLSFATTTVLQPIIGVITSIANVISKVLVTALKGLTPIVNGIKDIFEKVFGGLYNIVKIPVNKIIDVINVFIGGLNKLKIPDWIPIIGGQGVNLPLLKKLRVGIDYVPYDEMPAMLHKGEAVLTAEENKDYQQGKNNNIERKEIIYNNNINIEKLEVREDTDIERIAEELYFLQKKEVGA